MSWAPTSEVLEQRRNFFPPSLLLVDRHCAAVVQAGQNTAVHTSSPPVQFPQFHVCAFPKPKSLQNRKITHVVPKLWVGTRLLSNLVSHSSSHEAGQKKGTIGHPANRVVCVRISGFRWAGEAQGQVFFTSLRLLNHWVHSWYFILWLKMCLWLTGIQITGIFPRLYELHIFT